LRFLVDAQLPPALARVVAAAGHEAEHVADIGLEAAPDAAIYDYARRHGCVLITKDEDFRERRRRADRGPCVVWVRVGNASRQALLRWFLPLLPEIIEHIDAGEAVIEIR
jgi:predicted nuclease of predicted toxin-antitoxin system